MTYFDAGASLVGRAICCGKPLSAMRVGIKWISYMSQRGDPPETELHGMSRAAISDMNCPIERN